MISVSEASSCSLHDKTHNFICPLGKSLYSVSGSYSGSYKKDRQYCYGCQSHSSFKNYETCYNTKYVNNWDLPVAVLCKPDHFIVGVRSYHNNHFEDRRFRFRCCKFRYACTRYCYYQGPVNKFHGSMKFSQRGKVIVGAFSWHNHE